MFMLAGLKYLYSIMEYDSYGWWINNVMIGEPHPTNENKPTFEEFLQIIIDKAKENNPEI